MQYTFQKQKIVTRYGKRVTTVEVALLVGFYGEIVFTFTRVAELD